MGIVKKKPKTKRPKLGEGSYRQGTRPDDPRGADYRKRYIITPNMVEKYSKKLKLKTTPTEIRKMMREEERRRRMKLKQAENNRLMRGRNRKKKVIKQQSTRGYA